MRKLKRIYLFCSTGRVSENYSRGTWELIESLRLVAERGKTARRAIEGSRLKQIPLMRLGSTAEVWALSPSNRAVENSLSQVALLIPEIRSEVGRLPVPAGPNNYCAVIQIVVGEVAILLGGDMETGRDPESGWPRIVSFDGRPTLRSGIFKVAHHGSQNAHSDEVWAKMLCDRSFALLTPYNKGRKLPSEEDVTRVLGLTENAFITASSERRISSAERDRQVNKLIRSTAES